MGIYLDKYTDEVLDFICADTLYEIDCGILDLSHVSNVELREAFRYAEVLLTVELILNYRCNGTGIFRVHFFGDVWCYCEEECVITASSCSELKSRVISQHGIWYVFDEVLAEELEGKDDLGEYS